MQGVGGSSGSGSGFVNSGSGGVNEGPRRAVGGSLHDPVNRAAEKKPGFMAGLSLKKKKDGHGLDAFGRPITMEANIPGHRTSPPGNRGGVSGSGGTSAEPDGDVVIRYVMHGPLKYRLSFDRYKWDQASIVCSEELMRGYASELPKGFNMDPSLLGGAGTRPDDDAIDKKYRKLYGTPHSQIVQS